MNCFVSCAEMLRGTDQYLSWPTQEMKSHSLSSHYVAGIVGIIGSEQGRVSGTSCSHMPLLPGDPALHVLHFNTQDRLGSSNGDVSEHIFWYFTAFLFSVSSTLKWFLPALHRHNESVISLPAKWHLPVCGRCAAGTRTYFLCLFHSLWASSLSWRVGHRVGMSYTMQPTLQSSVLSVGCLNVRESNLDIGLGQQETIKGYWVTGFHVHPNK